MKSEKINKLRQAGLKVTPQRTLVLEATEALNHPTAESIIEYVAKKHNNIAVGTIYKILETFVDNGILLKVKTDKDYVRYDSITSAHHHLYSIDGDRIEDYFDEGLDTLLKKYFRDKKIENFSIESIKLQISGYFKKNEKAGGEQH